MKKEQEFGFSSSLSTKICLEQASDENPFVCEARYLSGYDNIELAKHKSFIDVLLLLFHLELPSEQDKQLLEMLMIGLITPGTRHPATRAAMTAGISKANAEHILPIAFMSSGGPKGGASEVQLAQKLFYRLLEQGTSVEDFLAIKEEHIPGFASEYGQADCYINSLALTISASFPHARHLAWCLALSEKLQEHGLGLTDTGLAAAIFCDLQIGSREGVGLYQLIIAPGLVAHGMEQTHKPITDMPLLEDKNYHYPRGAADE